MASFDVQLGDRISVGGRTLWTNSLGEGSSVVFMPGAGSFGIDMFRAARQIADAARVVLYDRAGTGFSDDVSLPRPASDVTAELRALLSTIGAEPPFVLVGHSLGGAYAQRFAQEFPSETTGLVLLDPIVHDWNREMPAELRIGSGASQGYTVDDIDVESERSWLEHELGGLPAAIRDAAVSRHLAPDRLLTGPREGENFLEVLDELAPGPSPVPAIVLHATEVDPLQAAYRSPDLLRRQISAMRRLYLALVSAPESYRVLPTATHSTIATSFPVEIAQAVTEILSRR